MATILTFHPTHREATPSTLQAIARVSWTVALAMWRAPARIRANRQLAHTLGRMSDHQLGDLGLNRQDALDSTAQPMLDEVGAFLATRVAERRKGRGAVLHRTAGTSNRPTGISRL